MAQIERGAHDGGPSQGIRPARGHRHTIPHSQFGRLIKSDSKALTPEVSKNLIYEILTPAQRQMLEQNLQLDFSYKIMGLARFRGNVILQKKGLDANFRIIPPK